MCQNIKYLSKSLNGNLIQCNNSKNYQLYYKNLTFNLTPFELESFKTYLLKIDISYWEKEYENSIYDKKIPIPTLQINLILLIDRHELYELVNLLNFKQQEAYLTLEDIKYPINLN